MRDYTLKNKLGYKLTEEQNEIVDKLLKNDRFFNASQTGFGKTLTTITAAVHKMIERKEDDIHVVMVVPNPAVKAFTDTLGKQLGVAYNLYTATKVKTQTGARFHIFNYNTLSKDLLNNKKTRKQGIGNPMFDRLKELKRAHPNLWLIADEAHVLQDINTAQYKVMKAIMPWFIGVWFLTATPILNNLEGLFYMTTLVDPTFSNGNIYSFRNKYMVFAKSGYFITRQGRKVFKETQELIGYKNLDILKERFDKISVIKSRNYNLKFNYVSTPLNNVTMQFYKRAAEGLFSGTVTTKKGRGRTKTVQEHAGARLHDLQRVVSNSHKDFKILTDPNRLTEKEVLLIKTIVEVLNKNQAMLIYFSYTETLDRIKYLLTKLKDKYNISGIFEISGSVSQEQRKKIEDLISPRSITLITSAGTESVNLQKANNIIFYEVPFSLRQFIQACGRIARHNSTFDDFNVYIVEAEGTIDTYKKNRIVANSGPIEAVLNGSNALPTELADLTLKDIQDMKNEYLWLK